MWIRLRCLWTNHYTRFALLLLAFAFGFGIFDAIFHKWWWMVVDAFPAILGLFVLWLLDFGDNTVRAYRSTRSYFKRHGVIRSSFGITVVRGGYCYVVGFLLALKDCKVKVDEVVEDRASLGN